MRPRTQKSLASIHTTDKWLITSPRRTVKIVKLIWLRTAHRRGKRENDLRSKLGENLRQENECVPRERGTTNITNKGSNPLEILEY